MLSRTNRVSPFGLFRRLALSARCCFLTSAAMLHTRESISTNLPTPAPSAGPSAGRCTSRPTSPRTVCTTHGELVFGQYVVHFCASCSLITALRFEGSMHIRSSLRVGHYDSQTLWEPSSFVVELIRLNPSLKSCWWSLEVNVHVMGLGHDWQTAFTTFPPPLLICCRTPHIYPLQEYHAFLRLVLSPF